LESLRESQAWGRQPAVHRDALLPVSAEVGKAAHRPDAALLSDESGRRLGASPEGQQAEPDQAQVGERVFAPAERQRVSARSVRPEQTVRRRPGGPSQALPAEPGEFLQAQRVERVVRVQGRRLAWSMPQGVSASPVSVVRRRVSLEEQRLPLQAE